MASQEVFGQMQPWIGVQFGTTVVAVAVIVLVCVVVKVVVTPNVVARVVWDVR